MITGWGNDAPFEKIGWSIGITAPSLACITCMAHLFFARRLHIIAKQRWLTCTIVLFSVVTFCAGIGAAIAMLWVEYFVQYWRLNAIVGIWAVSPVITDVIVTGAMTYYLRRYKGNFEATDHLLNHVIQRKFFFMALISLHCLY